MTSRLYPAAWAAALAVAFGWTTSHGAQAGSCESLAEARLPNTHIAVAQRVTDGSFAIPRNGVLTELPAFCRVAGEIAPTSESHIRFEVWMPLQNWNGKLAGVGNGGWSGDISYPALAQQLQRGYASASTDTGHESGVGADMAKFAYEHPEQLVDFAHRSHHETAVKAKALLQTFYGKGPDRSYFIGCSSGGYEGLTEAQRYPADYDGIVAGAPANNWTRLMAADFDASLAMLKDSASLVPRPALQLVNRAAIATCDKLDGIEDGVIDDPRRCTFDPAVLKCGAEGPSAACLTPAQIEAVRRVYRGVTDPRTGAPLSPGVEPGSEMGWPNVNPANPFPIPVAHYKWLVFADSNWNWRTFDFSSPADYQAFQRAESKFAPLLNATNPDLRAFRQHGGKLLQYHGWIDNLIAPRNSIDYYESVIRFFTPGRQDRSGALSDVQTFYRLYMAPGMSHCGGGPGPNTFNLEPALEQWVEHGVAPQAVVAAHSTNGSVDRSRPLCPYPQRAVYTGTGSTKDAANFRCGER